MKANHGILYLDNICMKMTFEVWQNLETCQQNIDKPRNSICKIHCSQCSSSKKMMHPIDWFEKCWVRALFAKLSVEYQESTRVGALSKNCY